MNTSVLTPAAALLTPDPIQDGIANGWQAFEAHSRELPSQLECDVVVIGTGAGGGISAEMLTKAGLRVILVEEGPLKSSKDFKMKESQAYPSLYQEAAARKTADKAITILQGRAVGGSTTVNWTSSFRTPPATLAFWQSQFGLSDFSVEAMAPWFEQAERRLNIADWQVPPNENNDILRRGAEALGLSWGAIRRNVRDCWNLGYCGMGCPVNAKQSMLVSTIPVALDGGAQLIAGLRAVNFEIRQRRVQALNCDVLRPDGLAGTGRTVQIKAKHYILAGGSINSPAVLLHSGAADPYNTLGTRTFLHPVVISAAKMPQDVHAYSGAPQTIYSDHYLDNTPLDGPLGFKLEAPPVHPVIFASTLPGFGQQHAQMMQEFSKMHMQLALIRDGFHRDSVGGSVRLRGDGSPVLDYRITPAVWDAARRALLAMAEIQHAAGCEFSFPVHDYAKPAKTIDEARAQIAALPMQALVAKVVSAHVMGGCRIGADERNAVVRPDGVHWQIENLSVHDGSLFPTSIGANPQLSIYGMVNRLTSGLIQSLTGQAAPILA